MKTKKFIKKFKEFFSEHKYIITKSGVYTDIGILYIVEESKTINIEHLKSPQSNEYQFEKIPFDDIIFEMPEGSMATVPKKPIETMKGKIGDIPVNVINGGYAPNHNNLTSVNYLSGNNKRIQMDVEEILTIDLFCNGVKMGAFSMCITDATFNINTLPDVRFLIYPER
jgi:hypothetical protein